MLFKGKKCISQRERVFWEHIDDSQDSSVSYPRRFHVWISERHGFCKGESEQY
jgi:hypothetical protein